MASAFADLGIFDIKNVLPRNSVAQLANRLGSKARNFLGYTPVVELKEGLGLLMILPNPPWLLRISDV